MKKILILCLAVLLTVGAMVPVSAAFSVMPGGSCAVDGVTYVTDRYSRAILAYVGGEFSTLVGGTTKVWLDGRPMAGYADTTYTKAAFADPRGIVPFKDGILVADRDNHALRYVDLAKKRVYTYAGRGEAGYRDSNGRYAAFDSPVGLASDGRGNIYIADSGNHAIRKMNVLGKVTTLVGGEEGCALGSLSATRLSYPMGVCYLDGVLYVADTGNHRIIAIRDGESTLVAGAELQGDAAIEGGYLDGPAELARFASPAAVAVAGDTVYVADSGNGAVRAISDGYVTSLAVDATVVNPDAFFVLDGALFVGDSFAQTMFALPDEVELPVFDDVDAADADVVRFALVNGLMNGVGEGKFSPDADVTLGMVMTILARLDGMDTTVGEAWYDIGMAWGREQGIIDLGDPAALVTAEDFDGMLDRYVGIDAPMAEVGGTVMSRIALARAMMAFLCTME